MEKEDAFHRTMLSEHLKETKSSSDYIMFWVDGGFSNEALMEIYTQWLFNCKNEEMPPDDFISSLSPEFIGDKQMTMAMLWIRYRKTIPPLTILHGTKQRDFDGNTLLMLWIQYANNKHIPECLLLNHDVYASDKQGRTAAMIYIDTYGELPPKCLFHDVCYKDNNGKTAAMHFLEASDDELPECLLHSPYVADNNGNTLEYYAIRYLHKFVEDWMVSNVYKNRNGDTVIMFALKYYKVIMDFLPSYIFHDPYNIRNRQQENLYDIVEKYCYGNNKINELMLACNVFY